MVLFRDLWKKYALPEKELSTDPFDSFLDQNTDETDTDLDSEPPVAPTQARFPPLLRQQYLHQNMTFEDEKTLKDNLRNLKQWVDQPKEAEPDLRFFHMKNHLKTPEAYEILRQERWKPLIYCPQCHSHNLSRLAQQPPEPPENHRYRCLDCFFEFNDDTGTPLGETHPPTIQTWIECWFLWGCTDSLQYIAQRLGLDIRTIERMLYLLKQLFQTEKPLSRLEESPQLEAQSQKLKERFKIEIQKTHERLNMQLANVPTDTLQHRQRETIRRHGRLDPGLELSPKVKPSSRPKKQF